MLIHLTGIDILRSVARELSALRVERRSVPIVVIVAELAARPASGVRRRLGRHILAWLHRLLVGHRVPRHAVVLHVGDEARLAVNVVGHLLVASVGQLRDVLAHGALAVATLLHVQLDAGLLVVDAVGVAVLGLAVLGALVAGGRLGGMLGAGVVTGQSRAAADSQEQHRGNTDGALTEVRRWSEKKRSYSETFTLTLTFTLS